MQNWSLYKIIPPESSVLFITEIVAGHISRKITVQNLRYNPTVLDRFEPTQLCIQYSESFTN